MNRLSLCVLALGAMLSGQADTIPNSCGLAFHVTDSATRQPIPGAAVMFRPYSLTAFADARGWVTWNVPSSRENFWTQARAFDVAAVAPGYPVALRTFKTPDPYRGPCSRCDDGQSLFSYEIELSLPGIGAPGVKLGEAEDTSGGVMRYDYMGGTSLPCCEGSSIICVDVIGGVPVGRVDWTGKNAKVEQSRAAPNHPMGKARADLVALGFLDEGPNVLGKAIEVDAEIGNRVLDPTLCGPVCIRRAVTRFTWAAWWVENGKETPHGVLTLDVTTGVCVSAGGLKKCSDPGKVDACGLPTK